jgi:hypothetical protein
VIITRALPHGLTLQPADEELYSRSKVLRVLTHDTYKTNQTEFVIFVELRAN